MLRSYCHWRRILETRLATVHKPDFKSKHAKKCYFYYLYMYAVYKSFTVALPYSLTYLEIISDSFFIISPYWLISYFTTKFEVRGLVHIWDTIQKKKNVDRK